MDTVIAAPASCEVGAVIRFLHAEGQIAALSFCVKKTNHSTYLSLSFDAMTTRLFLPTNRRLILE